MHMVKVKGNKIKMKKYVQSYVDKHICKWVLDFHCV